MPKSATIGRSLVQSWAIISRIGVIFFLKFMNASEGIFLSGRGAASLGETHGSCMKGKWNADMSKHIDLASSLRI